jgi:hypothetical protein
MKVNNKVITAMALLTMISVAPMMAKAEQMENDSYTEQTTVTASGKGLAGARRRAAVCRANIAKIEVAESSRRKGVMLEQFGEPSLLRFYNRLLVPVMAKDFEGKKKEYQTVLDRSLKDENRFQVKSAEKKVSAAKVKSGNLRRDLLSLVRNIKDQDDLVRLNKRKERRYSGKGSGNSFVEKWKTLKTEDSLRGYGYPALAALCGISWIKVRSEIASVNAKYKEHATFKDVVKQLSPVAMVQSPALVMATVSKYPFTSCAVLSSIGTVAAAIDVNRQIIG